MAVVTNILYSSFATLLARSDTDVLHVPLKTVIYARVTPALVVLMTEHRTITLEGAGFDVLVDRQVSSADLFLPATAIKVK